MKSSSAIFLFLVLGITSCNSSSTEKDNATVNKNDSISTREIISDSNLKKIHFCAQLIPKETIGQKQAGAQSLLLWPEATRSLNVTFLDGDPLIQDKVKQVAKEWENYCGIKFNFGVFDNPDISISFKQNGSWSWVGNSSAKHNPSMNYGWFNSQTSNEEYHRVVLHEFGHALGFIHEHQNPYNNPIHWNKPLVYQYLMRPPNNWSKDEIDRNLFAQYERNKINGTEFDPNSIMLYAFPKDLTIDGYSTNSNTQLSNLDKALIAELYPIN